MKCKGKDQVPAEKQGLLGFRKTFTETRNAEVDSKRVKKMKNKRNTNPYSVEEMLFYDDMIRAS